MNLNLAIVAGRLTADVELRNTPSGMAVASFSVATNYIRKNQSGQKEDIPEFHRIVVWGDQAQYCAQFLTKGSIVLVEGRLQTRTWEDKQGGKRQTTEIIASRVNFGPRPQGPGGPPMTSGPAAPQRPGARGVVGHMEPVATGAKSNAAAKEKDPW